MNLLVDTHVVLAMVEEGDHPLPPSMRSAIDSARNRLSVSVTSLWEVAIKARLGRLTLKQSLETLTDGLEQHGCSILDLSALHVLTAPEPMPPTRDPFDRVLLSICAVEGMRLMTWDDKLRTHPLAWRPGSA